MQKHCKGGTDLHAVFLPKDQSVIGIMLTDDDGRWWHSLYLVRTKGQRVLAFIRVEKTKTLRFKQSTSSLDKSARWIVGTGTLEQSTSLNDSTFNTRRHFTNIVISTFQHVMPYPLPRTKIYGQRWTTCTLSAACNSSEDNSVVISWLFSCNWGQKYWKEGPGRHK